MAIDAVLKHLNDEQKEAVTASLGNCLVLAGAGSGKTAVLVSRIAWLILHEHFSPYAILAVTFTNKAANEMRERLKNLINTTTTGMWVGTFHGLCHRILRQHHKEASLPDNFQIIDAEDQGRLIKKVLIELKLDLERWPVKQVQGYINHHKDEGLRPDAAKEASLGGASHLSLIYRAYEAACQKSGLIDFAEIMLRCYELLRDYKEVLAVYQQRFKAILVDEFQDTNTIQYAWLRLLAGAETSVMVVGDDDQAIYGWRGAKCENMDRFSQDYEKVGLIRLEQNYRSTQTILEAANALIAHNTRLGKNLWSAGQRGEKIQVYHAINELEEARFVTHRLRTLLERPEIKAQELAILYRSNAQSRVLEEALLREGLAYRIHGGLRFFERAEIKDAMAYLRLLHNPHDDAAFERVVNFPTRGIGDKTLDELRGVAKQEISSLWQAAESIAAKGSESRGLAALLKFIHLIQALKENTQDLALENQVKQVIHDSGLYGHYGKIKGEKSESKLENLNELINAARQFHYAEGEEQLAPLTAFLAHACLEAGEMQAGEHEDYVQLMTLHAAKGLEFPYVFIVGVEEGVFPSRLALEERKGLEEERRLCYVGMTRAKILLTLCCAEVRRQHGREEYHKPSRFLKEIPTAFMEDVRLQSKRTRLFPDKLKQALMEETGLRLGQRVEHAHFGSGVIIAVEGSGASQRIQVNFETVGPKWLVQAYANLVAH